MGINFVKNSKYCMIVSAIVIIVGIVMMFVPGLVLDTDFSSGTTFELAIGQEFNEADIEAIVSDVLGMKASSVQKSGDDKTNVLIKTMPVEDPMKRSELVNAIADKYGLDAEAARLSVDTVGPTVGKELQQSAIMACIVAVILMLIYISFRFEFMTGLSAIIKLAHDVLVILAVYAIFRIPVSLTFIAAVLTIIGYAINDSIVVFDRIRENRRLAKKESAEEIVNKSIKQTLTRSINTSITTLIPVILLYFMGVRSIKDLAFPLIIGVVVGTYSSICIAAPLWVKLSGGKKKKKA